MSRSYDRKYPEALTDYRTITALDGFYVPLTTQTSLWMRNNTTSSPVGGSGFNTIWVHVDLAIRGLTALADDPVVTFRSHMRSGFKSGTGTGGAAGYGATTQIARPRMKDVTGIKFQKTTNNEASFTDYSANVIDNNATTKADLDALDTAANGDFFYIGGPVPFLGTALDMDATNVNSNASVLSAKYWDGSAWQSLTNLTDGTAASGATLGQDGQVSWSLPTDWATKTINGISAYWARFQVSALLSASVYVEECDLLMPAQAWIEVGAAGDDVAVLAESISSGLTGTPAYNCVMKYVFK